MTRNQELGRRIRERRLARGFTITELAIRSEDFVDTIRDAESGARRPDRYHLADIAHALGCTVEDLTA